MTVNLRDAVGKEKLSCEEKFSPLQSAIRKVIINERIFGTGRRLGELKIIEKAITDIRSKIRDTSVSNETCLLNTLIGLKCMGNVAQSSIPQQLAKIDEIIEKVNESLKFCNEILNLINMNLPSTEEFIYRLCQKVQVKPEFLMACCDGLFNSLPFILEDEETMTNCLKIFFKTYLQQNETLKLKDFYIKIPEDIRPSMLKKGFLKKIAEKTAEEELDIMFDEEREKLVRISFLLKTLRKYLEEKRKVNLEEVSGKMNISLGITIQMALKLLKEELEEAIKFIQY